MRGGTREGGEMGKEIVLRWSGVSVVRVVGSKLKSSSSPEEAEEG